MFAFPHRTMRQTIRSSTQYAYRPSHIGTATAAGRFSTQSASVYNERVKQVVDQLHTSGPFGSGAEKSKSPGQSLFDIKSTRTKQLVGRLNTEEGQRYESEWPWRNRHDQCQARVRPSIQSILCSILGRANGVGLLVVSLTVFEVPRHRMIHEIHQLTDASSP
jgi:hypothetical protein